MKLFNPTYLFSPSLPAIFTVFQISFHCVALDIDAVALEEPLEQWRAPLKALHISENVEDRAYTQRTSHKSLM